MNTNKSIKKKIYFNITAFIHYWFFKEWLFYFCFLIYYSSILNLFMDITHDDIINYNNIVYHLICILINI